MKTETRNCQNCKQDFVIEADDFGFYEKINVPAPTFCSNCQLQRKYAFRNERALYKRKCNVPEHSEDLISIYSLDKSFKVYDQKFWWSDGWDPAEFQKEYDFSISFFSQLKKLIEDVPWPSLASTNSTNSDFCNSVLDMKNCYLVFAAIGSENCGYAVDIDYCKDSYDLYYSFRNELCYETLFSERCYKSKWIYFSENCTDSIMLLDCVGCTNCFGCVGLRNKSYCVFNKPYSKMEYEKLLEKYDSGSFSKISEARKKFKDLIISSPMRYARTIRSSNVTGDNIDNSRNCRNCFDNIGEGLEDCKDVVDPYGKTSKHCHSIFAVGGGELCYDSISIRICRNIFFSKKIWTGSNIQYSYNCHSCNDIFACVGLRNKQYCILNKQYTKEEYDKLVPRIIEHMNTMPYVDRKGRVYKYGEFFPIELSPFAYNETIAQEYFPLAKADIERYGYIWKNPETRNYEITIKSQETPDHIKEVGDDILNQVIGCEHAGACSEQCTTAFKLIPQELQFYRKMNLPLPRLCPNCRHYQRLKQRNPLKLWHRQCMCDYKVYPNTTKHLHHPERECPNEFETSYAPERKEIVYCEQCYQAEVI